MTTEDERLLRQQEAGQVLMLQESNVPGWCEVGFDRVTSMRLLVKIAQRHGRWVVVRLVVAGDLLDSAALKSIPIARIEAMLNVRGIGDALAHQDKDSHDDYWTFSVGPPAQLTERLDAALTAYLDRATPPDSTHPFDQPEREPLARPDGSDPDGFYCKVALAYNEFISRGTLAPAKAIAVEADVPVATVHRWIRESRQRGFLPPARKGKAG